MIRIVTTDSNHGGPRAVMQAFDIDRVARMTSKEVDALLSSDTATVVRHRGKIESIINNAKCIQKLIAEGPTPAPTHGHFDALLWSFVGGTPILNEWPNAQAIPSESATANELSAALKARGFKFVGPKICYSLLQSCGLVIDHPKDTPEHEAAKARLLARPSAASSSVCKDSLVAQTRVAAATPPARAGPKRKKR